MAASVSGLGSAQAGYQARHPGTGKPLTLAMQRLWLTGRVLPVGAHLFVQHQFRNGEKEPIEAVYTFALPRDAALRRFVLRGEGFVLRSELRPAAKAAEIYEDAIEDGNLAMLAREYDDGLVSLSLGNLRPGEEVSVSLEILAGVESHDDRIRFRFPFTLAPGYHSQARSIACPDGTGEIELPSDRFGDLILPRWFRDASELHAVGCSLEVFPDGGDGGPESPSHAIQTGTQDGHTVVTLRQSTDIPDRDLVLDLPVPERDPAAWIGKITDAEASPAETGALSTDRNHWVARIPSGYFGEPGRAPLRIVFVVDCSGSMQGLPLEQAKVALQASLGCLEPEDHFSIVAFGSGFACFADGLTQASPEQVRTARRWIAGLNTMGGTEIVPPLAEAIRQLEGSGSVLLITDGQVFGQTEILAMLEPHRIAVHSLGIGEASQDAFLAKIADSTNATSRFVSARERVDREAMELFAETRERIGTELEIRGLGGERPATVHNVSNGSVYARRPVLVFGEGSMESEVTLALRWKDAEDRQQSRELSVPARRLGETAALLAGAKRIAALAARMPVPDPAGDRERERVERALETLSREYGLASRAMSLVAVHERTGDVSGTIPRTVVAPVGMPRDQRFGAYFGGRGIASLVLPAVAEGQRKREQAEGLFASAAYVRCPPPSPASEPLKSLSFDKPDDKSAFPTAKPDPLPELAARFEPDGGLPGQTADERVRETLCALIGFAADGSTLKRGPYRTILMRGLAFVRANAESAGTHADLVRRIAEAVESGTCTKDASLAWAVHGGTTLPWAELARYFQSSGLLA